MALAIACEVHPLQNLRVLRHLRSEFKLGEEEVNRWAQHWIHLGLLALEEQVRSVPKRGKFCFGDTVSLADVCLIPQLSNARRFGCDLTRCLSLVQIESNCVALPAFAKAAPENQPDAE
jgi:maleylacetoacetate isomerase